MTYFRENYINFCWVGQRCFGNFICLRNMVMLILIHSSRIYKGKLLPHSRMHLVRHLRSNEIGGQDIIRFIIQIMKECEQVKTEYRREDIGFEFPCYKFRVKLKCVQTRTMGFRVS